MSCFRTFLIVTLRYKFVDNPKFLYENFMQIFHSNFLQEQPLLLEDLLEQEKREQARHTGTTQMDQIMPNQNQQSILNDQVRLL